MLFRGRHLADWLRVPPLFPHYNQETVNPEIFQTIQTWEDDAGEAPDLVDQPQLGEDWHAGGRLYCCSPSISKAPGTFGVQDKCACLAHSTFSDFLTLNYEHCCLLCVILLQKNGGKLGRPNPVQELQRLPLGESGTFNIALLLIRILALYSLHLWWDNLNLRG